MDKEFLLNLAITTILAELKHAVKNPVKKAVLKPVMLKIASVIMALWSDEPNFGELVKSRTLYERDKMK